MYQQLPKTQNLLKFLMFAFPSAAVVAIFATSLVMKALLVGQFSQVKPNSFATVPDASFNTFAGTTKSYWSFFHCPCI